MNTDSILTVLRDPVWQFIGAAIAIAALLLSYTVFLAQRQRRRITFQRIASIPLLTVKEQLAGRLSVTFDERPVRMIRTTTLRIQNAGNLPITSADYIEPIVIHAEVDAKIVSADVVDATPPSLRPQLTVTDRGAKLEPLLLNPGDAFVVKLLVQDGSEFAFLSGRVVGVKTFERVSDPDRRVEYITLVGMLLCVLGQGSLLLFSPKRPEIERTTVEYVALAIMIVGFIIWIGAGPFARWRRRKLSKESA